MRKFGGTGQLVRPENFLVVLDRICRNSLSEMGIRNFLKILPGGGREFFAYRLNLGELTAMLR